MFSSTSLDLNFDLLSVGYPVRVYIRARCEIYVLRVLLWAMDAGSWILKAG